MQFVCLSGQLSLSERPSILTRHLCSSSRLRTLRTPHPLFFGMEWGIHAVVSTEGRRHPPYLFFRRCGSCNVRLDLPISRRHPVATHTLAEGLADFGTWLSTTLGGPAVFSVQLGTSSSSDRFAGYFANMNAEVDAVCHAVRSNPALKGGFYAIGLSQGALVRHFPDVCRCFLCNYDEDPQNML